MWVVGCGVWGHRPLSASAVPSRVGQASQLVLHLVETEGSHGDGGRALVLEAGLEVEGHQEFLADEQRPTQAWQTAQVLQVAPQEHRALALLSTVPVHRQHMDVDRRGVGDVGGHGFLNHRKRGVDKEGHR